MPAVIGLRGSKRLYSSWAATSTLVDDLMLRPKRFSPPLSLHRRVTVSMTLREGWPVYRLSPRPVTRPSGLAHPPVPAAQRAIYLHGGSWIGEIGRTQWSFAASLVELSGTSVVVPIYPVAPEGTAATVVPIVADITASLIDEVGAPNVSIIGDSAGGTIALAAAIELQKRGLGPLGQTVLVSPGLDLTFSDPRVDALADQDPFLAVPGLLFAAGLWAGGLALDDPLVSPLFADLEGLGPLTVYTGTRDILNPDAHRIVSRAREAGVGVTLHEGRSMLHNFPLFPIPEGALSRARIAALLR